VNEQGQPQEDVTEIGYDGRDNVIYSVDAEGRTVEREIDGFGRLQSATHRDEFGTLMAGYALTWDPATGRLTGRTDPTGNGTAYAYDEAGRLSGKTFADGSQVGYSYNGVGELVQATDANGSVTTLTPDALGRAVNLAIAPGAGVATDATFVEYRYDGTGNVVYGANDGSLVRRVFDSRGSGEG
jgi:YD repeat-containing protein